MHWKPMGSAPKNGIVFQAWLVNEKGAGFWEPRCLYDENGRFGIWGRVDYDEEGWDFDNHHLKALCWLPTPPVPDKSFWDPK